MVKATLLELQFLEGLITQTHTTALRAFPGDGRGRIALPRVLGRMAHASQLPWPPADEWRHGTNEEPKRIASLLARKRGIACSRLVERHNLYGNGVAVVPNVHAVMAWAACKIEAVNVDISSEELRTPTTTGEGQQSYTKERKDGDNECYQNEPSRSSKESGSAPSMGTR